MRIFCKSTDFRVDSYQNYNKICPQSGGWGMPSNSRSTIVKQLFSQVFCTIYSHACT